MPALGLADLGNLFGAVKFYKSCRGHGVKPVIGCEVRVSGNPAHHLLLLCADNRGYRTLNGLLTRAYADNHGRHRRTMAGSRQPRANCAVRRCARRHRPRFGNKAQTRRAWDIAGRWKECLGDRFYVEVWRATADDPQAAAASVAAAHAGLPVVATHPVQCTREQDRQMLEVRRLHCAQLATRRRYPPRAVHRRAAAALRRRNAGEICRHAGGFGQQCRNRPPLQFYL